MIYEIVVHVSVLLSLGLGELIILSIFKSSYNFPISHFLHSVLWLIDNTNVKK